VIFDLDMACEHHIVGEKDVVAEATIMRDMRMRKQHAAIANIGRHAPAGRAGVDGHALADDAIGADVERGRFAGIFAILRRMTDRRERKDSRARTDMRAARDNGMRNEFDPVVENGVTSDLAKSTDRNARAEFGPALHECKRVDENG
jgi:protein tyrosine phosphatase (PTP) superfamily phosphohydrolase (DUF442 family)